MHCLCVCARVCVRVHACEFTRVALVNAAVCRFSRFRGKSNKALMVSLLRRAGNVLLAMFSNPTVGRKKKKKSLLMLFLDVFFQSPPPLRPHLSFFLSFVSDAAHSCRITGFNRLLLCSVAFQILRPAPRTLPDAGRRI